MLRNNLNPSPSSPSPLLLNKRLQAKKVGIYRMLSLLDLFTFSLAPCQKSHMVCVGSFMPFCPSVHVSETNPSGNYMNNQSSCAFPHGFVKSVSWAGLGGRQQTLQKQQGEKFWRGLKGRNTPLHCISKANANMGIRQQEKHRASPEKEPLG